MSKKVKIETFLRKRELSIEDVKKIGTLRQVKIAKWYDWLLFKEGIFAYNRYEKRIVPCREFVRWEYL